MAKRIKKVTAMLIVALMSLGMIAPQALAAETTTTTDTQTTTEGGVTTTVETITQTTVDGETTTVVVTINTTKTGVDETGAEVNYNETRTETTVTTADANGTETTEKWEEDGSETHEWVNEMPEDAETPVVTVPVEMGGSNTVTGDTFETERTGDEPSGEDDTTYDYTDTSVGIEREVTVTASDPTVTVNDSSTGVSDDEAEGLVGLAPVYDENDDVVYGANGKILDTHGKLHVFDRNYLSGTNMDPTLWVDSNGNPIMPEDADLRYVGTGEHSVFWTCNVYVTYEKEKDADGNVLLDEDGNPIYAKDEFGNPIIESITRTQGDAITSGGVEITELPEGISLVPTIDNYNGSRPVTFMLMDENGNTVFGYCCDIGTPANKGTWYTFSNLEDCEYYASEESEDHVRTIVMNGYWGTSDIPDENGEYATGSLEGIKQDLRDAINSGELENTVVTVPVLDENGNPVVDENGDPVTESKTMLELIDDLSEGEALLATQAAIWSYSNGHYSVMNGEDGMIIVDPDGYKWNHDPSQTGNIGGECLDDYGSARVDFLYLYLINLDTTESSTIIINEENYIEDISLTVGEQVDEIETTDADGNAVTNGVYNTALNFTLAFIPGANDDLLMQLSYVDLDGQTVTVIKRLAGENEGEEAYETIYPGEDGAYTISGLKLSENEDFNFDLRLEGTQYLEQGVYVYQAIGGREQSQTMVGIAEGEREVDISMGVTVSFSVTDENKVVAERHWHDEYDPTVENNNPPPPGNDPPPPPPEDEFDPPVPGEEIPDEQVPLADVPYTGDDSSMWLLVIAPAGMGLVALKLSDKKREDEEI